MKKFLLAFLIVFNMVLPTWAEFLIDLGTGNMTHVRPDGVGGLYYFGDYGAGRMMISPMPVQPSYDPWLYDPWGMLLLQIEREAAEERALERGVPRKYEADLGTLRTYDFVPLTCSGTPPVCTP